MNLGCQAGPITDQAGGGSDAGNQFDELRIPIVEKLKFTSTPTFLSLTCLSLTCLSLTCLSLEHVFPAG